jgi:hypothetical protein
MIQLSSDTLVYINHLTRKIVEYDEPSKLMNKDASLFGQLVKEYWSRSSNATIRSEDYSTKQLNIIKLNYGSAQS